MTIYYLAIYLSIYISEVQSLCIYYLDQLIYLSINQSIYQSINLSIYQSIYLSIYQSINLIIYLSIFLFSLYQTCWIGYRLDHKLLFGPTGILSTTSRIFAHYTFASCRLKYIIVKHYYKNLCFIYLFVYVQIIYSTIS